MQRDRLSNAALLRFVFPLPMVSDNLPMLAPSAGSPLVLRQDAGREDKIDYILLLIIRYCITLRHNSDKANSGVSLIIVNAESPISPIDAMR